MSLQKIPKDMRIFCIGLVIIGLYCGTVESALIKESPSKEKFKGPVHTNIPESKERYLEKNWEPLSNREASWSGEPRKHREQPQSGELSENGEPSESRETSNPAGFYWYFQPGHSTEKKFEELQRQWMDVKNRRRHWRNNSMPRTKWVPWYYWIRPTFRPIVTPKPTTTTTTTTSTTTTQPPIPSFDAWLEEWSDEQEALECGLSEIEPRLIDLRIVGGTTAIRGSWPWMVSMKLAGQHWCGGVLISKQWVISSAHCLLFMPGVDNPDLWEIRLGRHDPGVNVTEPESEQRFNISGQPIFYSDIDVEQIHRQQPVDSDLVLLKLAKPATITKYVKPICLPKKSEDPEPGTRCVITGYGQTIPNVGSAVKLKQAIVPVVDYNKCHERDGYKKFLTERMICAGYSYGGVDTCKMDSGGPLQCFNRQRWILSGLTSWGDGGGNGCAEPLKPGVYTRITSYIEWIQTMLYENYVDSLIGKDRGL